MKYYIQNVKAGYSGNASIFWAQNSNGYTADLNKAHQYTWDEAYEICISDPEKNRAWQVDYIDNNEGIQRIVDVQYLRTANVVNFKMQLTEGKYKNTQHKNPPTISRDDIIDPPPSRL